MARLDFDVRVHDALRRADADPDAAAEALLIAADYLRRGEPLPRLLVEHLAGAIEAAMGKPAARRGSELLHELKLTARNRRPASDWLDVGAAFEQLVDDGASDTAAKTRVAADFGISETTVLSYARAYRQALALAQDAPDVPGV